MITLGIETSCDETALALIETRTAPDGAFECRVIASLVHSQAELHSAYGGVYPSLAKREHGKNIVPLMHKLLIGVGPSLSIVRLLEPDEFARTVGSFRNEILPQNPELFGSFAGADFLKAVANIGRIAVTEGPGLEPALWVGINFARMLGALWQIPVMPVDHMEGHVVGSLLASDAANGAWQRLKPLDFPALAFLLSGGHTELVKIGKKNGGGPYSYEIIGQTKDDAVGEAFDKAARLLGLPYPGGPHISKLSHEAWENKIEPLVKLPRPMMKSGDLDFSFSGLKTAVLYAVRAHSAADGSLTDQFKKGLAREFESAVMETLDAKLRSAIDATGARTVIVGGGVSANHRLRRRFAQTAEEYGLPLYLPTGHISGDNALMIAVAGAMASGCQSPAGTRLLKADGTKRLGR